MVAEIYGGIAAFKTMFDLAKGLKDINDAALRNSTSIELLEKILTAREAQAAALDRIRELEEQVAQFETWEAEKQRYELKGLTRGATAYMLKPDARGSEPPHWLCTSCFEHRKRSIMQPAPIHGLRDITAKCPDAGCSNAFLSHQPPQWLD